jgi:formylglycine-generating enzyme required for sulfatase activity
LVQDITETIGKPTRKAIATDVRDPGTIFRDTLKDGSSGPEMIVIPAGALHMGDTHGIGTDYEKPVHAVHFQNPFAFGRYQVAFDEYDKYAELTQRDLPNDEGWGRRSRPVTNVSWDEAVEYAKWLSAQTGKRYRLPTEAEWEYAAHSGGENEIWAGTSHTKELARLCSLQKHAHGANRQQEAQ